MNRILLSSDFRNILAAMRALALLVVVPCLFLSGCVTPCDRAATSPSAIPTEAALSSWNEGAPARAALVAYVEAVTDPESPDWIPPEKRIAVFDLDGTLFCETDPNYFDYTLLVHRVTEDPDYRDRASEAERETARRILAMNETDLAPRFPDCAIDVNFDTDYTD